jgi:hypothetical protein
MPVPPNQPTTLTARCGPRRHAVGGGFWAPTERTYLIASKRVRLRGWRVTWVNGGDSSAPFWVFANCAKLKGKLRVRSKTRTMVQPYINPVFVRCRGRREAISGGFETQFSGSDFGAVDQSFRYQPRRWVSSGQALAGAPRLTSYSYCR